MKLALKFLPASLSPFAPRPRPLLEGLTGLAKPGEMVLVLGRPGSGCSTFLKTISGRRGEYLNVKGDVHYSGVEATEFLKLYKGEAVYNPEADIHYPTLTVGQTLRFALSTKTPGKRLPNQSKGDFMEDVGNLLLRMLNISHTKNTLVGDEYVRGVSGGERKRVSIAEMMATGACECFHHIVLNSRHILTLSLPHAPGVVSYDGSTRGLDASTALDYAKSLRIMTDIFEMTTFVSIYQAGEGIYDQFDKVLVIDQGRQVYFGPAKEARKYFMDMGYADFPRQTTADYLSGCTDPNERRYASDELNSTNVPSTAEAMADYYYKSDVARRMREEMEVYKGRLMQHNPVVEFREAVLEAKGFGSSQTSPYQVGFFAQVLAIAGRQIRLKCVLSFLGDVPSQPSLRFLSRLILRTCPVLIDGIGI